MKSILIANCLAGILACSTAPLAHAETGWQTRVLHEQFLTEGASAGDIDGDGKVDLVAGPR